MPDDRCRLGSDDVVIGLDLASAEHQVVVLTAAGPRLTRFRIPHLRVGLEELLRRTMPAALGRAGGARVFAFEATGHVWEAVAYVLRARGERYVVVNPLTTFRVREARLNCARRSLGCVDSGRRYLLGTTKQPWAWISPILGVWSFHSSRRSRWYLEISAPHNRSRMTRSPGAYQGRC